MKWIGIQKWSWYLNLFFSISVGDQASFAMSPSEYLWEWDEEPRLMAILTTVQRRVRHNIGEGLERTKADARKRHIPTRPTIKR